MEKQEELGEPIRPRNILLPLNDIIVLTQHRKTFVKNDIRNLADNIARTFLMDPITVIAFRKKEAQEYVELINEIFEANHRLEDLPISKDKTYPVLGSGNNRLLSHELLWKEGCSVCLKKFGPETPGSCYQRHFPPEKSKGKIETRLIYNVPAIMAIDMQFSGNSYVPPPEIETIKGLSSYFLIKKRLNPDITIAKFAKSVGKSSDAISTYLDVCNLPEDIYKFFADKHIPLGIAAELAFLQKNGEKDLNHWLQLVLTKKNISISEFKKITRKYLATKNQTALELFDEKTAEEERRRNIRATVEKEMANGLHQTIAYTKKILQLYEENKLGTDKSPYAIGSPINLLQKQAYLATENVIPHMERQLSQEKAKFIKEAVFTGASVSKKLADLGEKATAKR